MKMTDFEALKTFGNLWMGYSTVKETYPKHYETIEKSLKALEIIKEKDVDVGLIKRSENWLDYYTRFKHRTGKNTELTEEEFDLLKEVLNNGDRMG